MYNKNKNCPLFDIILYIVIKYTQISVNNRAVMLKMIDITPQSGQVTSSQLLSANAKLVHLKCLELCFF